jgi:hypothetical protein
MTGTYSLQSHEDGRLRRARRSLRVARRKYMLTFAQCQKIIKLFIKGFSVAMIMENTGLAREKILEVLYLTREMLLRREESGAPRMTSYSWN